ncbi:DUF7827 domain-containing protein [Halococcoides cellulosivorans]|uniref:DUF7827 domain-containing protein n=1 Tax=Halococcoides cellulosivorans TaxID=1679096 RepID=A0A2R4X2Q9_9EURY|nr:BGTF surface domain-containing protein [Halococcoides cellulosivorans]AWB28087.1 hypothetical protein HARCEL1_10405 [Halococcoides cellulosivorans]
MTLRCRPSGSSVSGLIVLVALAGSLVAAGAIAGPAAGAVATDANTTATQTTETATPTDRSTADEQVTIDPVSVDRGDVARIQVGMDGTDTAFVSIGDVDDDGVRLIVRVRDGNDDGTVILEANTYNLIDATADNATRFRAADDADSVTILRHEGAHEYDEPLPVGSNDARSYELRVGTTWNDTSGGLGGALDRTVLRVFERSTTDFSTWAAPTDADLDSVSSIRSAQADGLMAETTAVGDRTAVLSIQASGLTGALRATNGSTTADRLATLSDGDVVRFSTRVSSRAGNPVSSAGAIDLRSETTRVVADHQNDTLFVVLESGSWPTTEHVSVEFAIPDESALNAGSDQRVSTSIDPVTVDPGPRFTAAPSGPIAVENASVVRGDVARIPVSVGNGDRVTVRLGSERAGWERIVRVADRDDDGQIDLRVNTLLAGDADPRTAIEATGEDGVVAIEAQSNDFDRALGAGPDGHYAYAVSAHEEYNATTATGDHGAGTLRVDQRSTDGIAIHSAPRSMAGELTGDASLDAIDDGRIVESQIVGQELILVELDATGLGGALAAANGSTPTERFLNATDGDPVSFGVENPFAFFDDPSVELTTSNVTSVVRDSETGHLIVVLDATTLDGGLTDGDQYIPELSIPEESPLSTGADRSVEEPFEYGDSSGINESAIVMFDDRSYAPEAEQPISGTTTLPPGTELTVGVESDLTPESESAFLTETSAVVAPDGSWSTTIDLSEGVEGQRFTADVVEPDSVGSVDAVIGEAPQETSVTPDRSSLSPEPTTLSGTSTFDPGTQVFLSLRPSLSDRAIYGGLTVRQVETTIGPDGDWAADVNLSGLDSGWYKLSLGSEGTSASAEYRIGSAPDPEPIAVRNYRRASAPTDAIQPSAVMDAKGDYLTGAISLESAVTVMRAYFFG